MHRLNEASWCHRTALCQPRDDGSSLRVGLLGSLEKAGLGEVTFGRAVWVDRASCCPWIIARSQGYRITDLGLGSVQRCRHSGADRKARGTQPCASSNVWAAANHGSRERKSANAVDVRTGSATAPPILEPQARQSWRPRVAPGREPIQRSHSWSQRLR